MVINNFEINVLVNGRRVKHYTHQGKTYVESKEGSNYTLEVKNNTPNRILVVSSVDGLSVLSGQPASDSDTGYVVDAYSKMEIKGFRYSDDAVGSFVFTSKRKNDSYAATKGNQQNCGIIGVRVFNEVVRPPIVVREKEYVPYNLWKWPYTHPTYPYPYDIIYGSGGTSAVDAPSLCTCDIPTEVKSSPVYGVGGMSSGTITGLDNSVGCQSINCYSPIEDDLGILRDAGPQNFDMATKWGNKVESKVTNVEFERGGLVYTQDIYYASRQSLIEMGIPMTSHQKIAKGPESFPGNYAKPPKGWIG
jgi:hypothetical protein